MEIDFVNDKSEFLPPNKPINKDLGRRDWGTETLLHLAEGKWSMKKLFIKAGSKGGLQYHRIKDEAAFLIKGKLIIRFLDKSNNLIEKTLVPGESIHFPPNCIHQEEALTDCLIIEVSTPHGNDRVRVEKLFGQNEKGGLPTTKIDEIKNLTTN